MYSLYEKSKMKDVVLVMPKIIQSIVTEKKKKIIQSIK